MNRVSHWPRWRLLISIAIFQAAWFACIAAAAQGMTGWGIAAVAVSITWQLSISARPGIDLALMGVAFATGLMWDTFLVQTNLVVYASHVPLAAVAPLWILALWAQLGTVLRGPLHWLHSRLWIAAVLAAVGGAAAYAAAARFGACAFPDLPLAMLVLAAGWAVLLPALLHVARRV